MILWNSFNVPQALALPAYGVHAFTALLQDYLYRHRHLHKNNGTLCRTYPNWPSPIDFGIWFFIDLPTYVSWSRIIIFQIIAGLGTGPNFLAPLIALQTLVSPGDNAAVTATFTFVRQISTAISVVIGAVLFQNQMQKRYTLLLRSGVSPQFGLLLTNGGATALATQVRDLPVAQKGVVINAYTESLQKMWIMYACVGIVGFLFGLAIQRHKVYLAPNNLA